MSVAPWIKSVRHAICAAALGLAAIGAGSNAAWAQAAAGDDDLEDHILNADKKLLGGILGAIGLAPPGSGETITYRERSPLVVPQARDLPPPGKVAKGSDWPVEPEIKQRKKEAAAELKGPGRKGQQYDAARPISGTDEARKIGDASTWVDDSKARKEPDFITMLMQGRLGGTWEEYGKFEGEPPRTSLVQPPPGYLTPSPAAPYGMLPRDLSYEKKEPKN